ncbi:Fur family transcriptional regulator [Pedobacter immunditicola]|uniref:Fur family transcriptional regulator n=1 Tax=Pedobacter immunditicola TaxID=3133440 RepID=UPI00309A0DDE
MDTDIEKRLKAKGIQPTAMRMLILDYFLKQPSAITLADVETGLAPSDRITIYRTLKTFEEKGIIHSIEDGTGATKYALCKEDCNIEGHHDLHVHFYCHYCKETICLPRTLIPEVKLPDGFLSEELNLLVKGKCPKCSQ